MRFTTILFTWLYEHFEIVYFFARDDFGLTFIVSVIQKKSASELHTIIVETYDYNDFSNTSCWNWYRGFKKNDFDFEVKVLSKASSKFEDVEVPPYNSCKKFNI